MRIITPTEDFRRIADSVCIDTKKMTQAESRKGWWRLQKKPFLENAELVNLVKSYNQASKRDITQSAADRGLLISHKIGPDLLWIEDSLSAKPNQLFEAIVVRTPLEPQSGTSRTLVEPGGEGGMASSQVAPQNSLENIMPLGSRSNTQEQGEKSVGVVGHSSPVSQSQKDTNEAANSLASVTPPKLGNSISLKTLREQPEFVIRKATGDCVESPTLEVGDIVELDEMESLRINCGGLMLLVIGYEVAKLVGGS